MKKILVFVMGLLFTGGVFFLADAASKQKKVLYIDSYHQGYGWSDGIEAGIKKVLGDKVDLKVIYLDTKRNNDEAFKIASGKKAKEVIEAYKPNVVIAADDNAAKYVIVPFYKDTKLPFVFCGLNWDASLYGFPCSNVTGMIEVAPYGGLIKMMSTCANGNRLGFLAVDNETTAKEIANMNKVGMKFEKFLTKSADDWKQGYKQLQNTVDMLIVDSDGGLYDDRQAELIDFVKKNTKIVTGSTYDFMTKYAMLNYAKVPQEQGEWAAQAALDILFNGKSPSDIPVVTNQKGLFYINKGIIKAAGITVPDDYYTAAKKVVE